MTIIQQIDVEPCPKCRSEDLKLWHSHRCQAFFVICKDCGHEDGREDTEVQAANVWNKAALSAIKGDKS